MSYISVNGLGSAISNTDLANITDGSTLPAIAVVSGTTYTALEWTLNSTNLTNGKGLYCFNVKIGIDGDATTAFEEVIVNYSVNGTLVYSTELLVGATLPDAVPHNFLVPFIFAHDTAGADIIDIEITPTFAGTAPVITSNTNIYRIV
jgi:hypothetical protein